MPAFPCRILSIQQHESQLRLIKSHTKARVYSDQIRMVCHAEKHDKTLQLGLSCTYRM